MECAKQTDGDSNSQPWARQSDSQPPPLLSTPQKALEILVLVMILICAFFFCGWEQKQTWWDSNPQPLSQTLNQQQVSYPPRHSSSYQELFSLRFYPGILSNWEQRQTSRISLNSSVGGFITSTPAHVCVKGFFFFKSSFFLNVICLCVSLRVQEWCPSTSSWSATLRRSCTGLTLPSTAPACPTAATTAASSFTQTPGCPRSVAAAPPKCPPTSPSSSPRHHSSPHPKVAAVARRRPHRLGPPQQPATSCSQPPPPPPPPLILIPSNWLPPPPYRELPARPPTTPTWVGPLPSLCPWWHRPQPNLHRIITPTCEWARRRARKGIRIWRGLGWLW